METLDDIVTGIATAAIHQAAFVMVTNDLAGPVRVLALEREGVALGAWLGPGESMMVSRAFRVQLEPVDSVIIRPLCCAAARWQTC